LPGYEAALSSRVADVGQFKTQARVALQQHLKQKMRQCSTLLRRL
jgi:hypothetical protein